MPTKLKYEQFLSELRQSKNNFRCKTLIKKLTEFGFDVVDGKKIGHKIFKHDGLPSFISSNFSCGHGTNNFVKPCYINNIRNILVNYKDELFIYLKVPDDED